MPRRDAINEKKKEQLALEHEQLQKLMFQARSTVRRSSLKEPLSDITTAPDNSNEAAEEPERPAIYPTAPVADKELTGNENTRIDLTINESVNKQDRTPVAEQINDINIVSKNGRSITVIMPDEHTANTGVYKEETIQNNAAAYEQPVENVDRFQDEMLAETSNAQHATIQRKLERKEATHRRTPRSVANALWLVAALLAGFGAYYFYQRTSNPEKTVAMQSKEEPLTSPEPSVVQTDTSTLTDETTTAALTEKQEPEKERTTEVTQKKAATKQTETQTTTATAGTRSALGQYKVISKAYFHDAPDESTRRKAFIIHWNNAVLTPQDEENGFVYIVFTNHLGQTSKGWLRKKDLQKLN